MKIAIIGTGYVGLVSGACFAEMGAEVVCVDIDAEKVERLRRGVMPIWEPGLEELVVRNCEAGRLSFSTRLAEVIGGVEVVFIAVGTPPDEDGSADLGHVLAAAREIGRVMEEATVGSMVVVTKSTVPVGTSDRVRAAIEEELAARGVKVDFEVAANPEFLKEGNAVEDFMRPDRVVVGVESEAARRVMDRLYKPFMVNSYRVIFTDIRSAEMIKYAANAMLATRISFMNDIANLCELVGADVGMVRKGIGTDPRIGSKFLYAGLGYGGSCFPKDVRALIRTAGEHGYRLELLEAVENVNRRQKEVLAAKVRGVFGDDLSGRVFGVWGLAFKPETDDVRQSAALVVVERLLEAGATVRVYDPVAMESARRELGERVVYCGTMYEAVEGADALILATEWKAFRMPDWGRVGCAMKGRVLFDGRNIYDALEVRGRGFRYFGVGISD
ncbi:MAG: UDP-glucose/GDP-mannose dehydrogenase family protein [Alistipes sp.]|jgi:UDPglucose 6-dehydrogenase|nr:UDP-glucose/GDP-mannose dehydrogenase family protein [Alistipes sp.]